MAEIIRRRRMNRLTPCLPSAGLGCVHRASVRRVKAATQRAHAERHLREDRRPGKSFQTKEDQWEAERSVGIRRTKRHSESAGNDTEMRINEGEGGRAISLVLRHHRWCRTLKKILLGFAPPWDKDIMLKGWPCLRLIMLRVVVFLLLNFFCKRISFFNPQDPGWRC